MKSTLLQHLNSLYPDSSNRTLRNWLKAGRITINGEVEVRASRELDKGDKVEVHRESQVVEKPPLTILFEDEHLLAIDKPAKLLSVPLDQKERPVTNAYYIMRNWVGELYPVHRLDRDTSGVLLFAKSREAKEACHELFKAHDLDRTYYAVVERALDEDSGVWESKLEEQKNRSVVSSKNGKTAITRFEVVKRTEGYTHLRLTLETGRKHQIRVHCKEAGHPVIGDKRYGSHHSYPRLALHAELLAFDHPFTGERLSFTSRVPGDLMRLK